MRARVLVPSMIRWARRWGAWLLAPLFVNAALWWGWIAPQRARVQQWRQARQLAQLRPDLETLVQQSDQALQEWRRGLFPSNDPQAAMQLLQKIADRHRVRLSGLQVQSASAPIALEAAGSFSQVANWIGELETVSGLQLEQWTVTAAAEPGQPHQAKLSLSAVMGAS